MATVIDDYITLGGQNLPISGFSRGSLVSEFATGLKIGKASNDNREHAFFLVMDDFSGGMGHRHLDIRDELGTFWDVLASNPPDLTRSGHATLGRPYTTTTLTALSLSSVALFYPFGDYPWYDLQLGGLLFGIGAAIYQLTAASTVAVRSNLAAKDNGAASNYGVASIISAATLEVAPNRILYAFYSGGNNGAFYYRKSTDSGATWTTEDAKTFQNGIWWDNKILVSEYSWVAFGTIADAATESWNLDDAADARPIAVLPVGQGSAPFIGVAQSPWGEPSVYVHDTYDMYVLDFFARKAYRIDFGGGHHIQHAIMHNGDIAVTDGWNVFLYSPGGGTIRNIGFPSKTVPPTLLPGGAGTEAVQIQCLATHNGDLYAAAAYLGSGVHTRIYVYNGVGWSQVCSEITDFKPHGMCVKVWNAAGSPYQDTRLYVWGISAASGTTAKLVNVTLPSLRGTPRVGVDTFGASGAQFITGWTDGGFLDLFGTLLRMDIDAFNLSATSTVKVEYQLDNDESGAWTQMVDTANAADVFDSTTRSLYFSATTPKRGLKFRTVRFRITLNRGGTNTDSPELRALTLVYLKTPEVRTAWTFKVDVNRMVEFSKSGNDSTFYVDGSPATMANVWAKLKTLWTNSHILLPLVIPNVEPSGVNVKISDIPITFDDFRDAVDGRGYIEIQCLEPVT